VALGAVRSVHSRHSAGASARRVTPEVDHRPRSPFSTRLPHDQPDTRRLPHERPIPRRDQSGLTWAWA
jgi:hypothetical protein